VKLNIGISPCPNDTFIFDALYSKTIDTTPFEFEFVFEDVETLNNIALKGQLDIIKLSYANYFNVLEQYVMLRSGGALGTGVGPLLISKETLDLTQMSSYRIAIPGIHTTANFLLSYAFPGPLQKNEVVFSSIEDVVLTNQVDAGVIIHENRFTYQLKGLRKMMDLGAYWEQQTQMPIPLGGIAIKRNLDHSIQTKINQFIQESIRSSRKRYPTLSEFVVSHAQEMSEDVMRQHIDLYVNDYSIDLGEKGKMAVQKMADTIGNHSELPLFI